VAGYGTVGRAVAELIDEAEDFVVVGVSDVSGARYQASGLALDEVSAAIDAGAELAETDVGEPIAREALLEAPCDVLVPAATSGVIEARNAGRIQARLVVEAANGPITAEADLALASRGVEVIPDILANAGGVIASYFEWAQGIQPMPRPTTAVAEAVINRLDLALMQAQEFAADHDLSLRDAALSIGVSRVAETHLARGLYP
jgi:glutamate dehydrogenase (NAD(P)+)